jgi:O-methyltransferase
MKNCSLDQIISTDLPNHHSSVFWGDRLLTLDKSFGFLEKPEFKSAYEKIHGNHKYDQYKSPHTVAWRLHTLCWAAQEALSLPGDFMECGTFKGDFAWVVSQCVAFASAGKTFYLYDSFEGFAKDDNTVDQGYADFANPIYQELGIYESVLQRFKGNPKVRVTRGYLPEALDSTHPAQISFLHMDLNSPRAEVETLRKLWPRIVTGGFIVFDDYGWKVFAKQKEEEDRFAAEKGLSILELPTGQGLLIKK